MRLYQLSLLLFSTIALLLLIDYSHANENVVATADDIYAICRGDEISIDFSKEFGSTKPLVYKLDSTSSSTLPYTLNLNRRTGILSGIIRDVGFRNVYNISVMATDPTTQESFSAQKTIQVDWCQGARVSRFWLVNTSTNTPTRVLKNGDVIRKSCLQGGFGMDVETAAEIATEAQSEGDLTDTVEFYWNGAYVRKESYWPYALGGDMLGNYNELDIAVGEHTVKAVPFNASGERGLSMEIVFTVVE